MASVLKFAPDRSKLEEEIKRRDDLAETSRRELFIAARKIQAWFRGVLTRNHLRKLHEDAITIQRHWRGYRERNRFDRYLIERVHKMWQDYYDRMATRIQAVWRGYWVRKTCLNMRQRQTWLNDVYVKNEETLENMRKFREKEMQQFEDVLERESMVWMLFILFKLHHLLRTKQRPGVITKIDETRFTVIEEMLKCFEYKLYVPGRSIVCDECLVDPKPSLVFGGTYYERCEKELQEYEKSLRSGNVPISRSEPYEEQEKVLNKFNRSYREILKRGEFKTKLAPKIAIKSTSDGKKCLRSSRFIKSSSNSDFPCIEPKELYEEIRKMDCRLHRLHIKCPIHSLSPCCQNVST